MFDTTKFGAYIAGLRKSADLTQSELADRLGLTRQAVSRYESGDSFPDLPVLKQMAAVFGVSLERLIRAGEPTEGEAAIISGAAEGRDVIPENISDLVNLAPWLKPSVLNRLAESLSKDGIDMSNLLSLAEYLNETDTQKLIKSVTFDSIGEMDMNLLERLLPLLGPYASEVIFQKILDGELDYHYLELFTASTSQVEAAVVYGVLDEDALNILRRMNYNRARMEKNGVIRLFLCPKCGRALNHFYPRRCKCGHMPDSIGNILHMTETTAPLALAERPDAFAKLPDGKALVLMLGAANIDGMIDRVFEKSALDLEFVVVDSDLERLEAAERKIHAKNYAQVLFALDDPASPHLMSETFDAIVDNTVDRLGDTETLRALLKAPDSRENA